MFELQRSLNPEHISLYDEAEKCLKAYPWLLDFCSYLNLDRPLKKMEWYMVCSEVNWLRRISSWRLKEEGLIDRIATTFPNDMVPLSLKEELFHLFCHFGGDSGPNIEQRSDDWYRQHYKVKMPLLQLGRGKQLLDIHRLRCLVFMSDYTQPLSDEQSYSNIITDAVDSVFDDDLPIPEEEMCKALEYSETNGLFIKIVPDEGHTQPEYNCPVHIEFVRELR